MLHPEGHDKPRRIALPIVPPRVQEISDFLQICRFVRFSQPLRPWLILGAPDRNLLHRFKV